MSLVLTECPECHKPRPSDTIGPREGYSRGIEIMCSVCDAQKRQCTSCGVVLPGSLVHFHRNKRGMYGLRSVCRKCHKQSLRINSHIRKARKHARNGKADLYMEQLNKLPEEYREELLQGTWTPPHLT